MWLDIYVLQGHWLKVAYTLNYSWTKNSLGCKACVGQDIWAQASLKSAISLSPPALCFLHMRAYCWHWCSAYAWAEHQILQVKGWWQCVSDTLSVFVWYDVFHFMKAGIKQLTTGLLHCGRRPNFDIELHNEVKNASTILYMYQFSWLQIWLFLLGRFKRRGWISCCSVPTDPWYN